MRNAGGGEGTSGPIYFLMAKDILKSLNIELRDGSLLIGQIGRKPFQIFGREFFIKTE